MKTVELKRMPSLRSDTEAKRFAETAGLSEYDLSNFKPMRFEIEPKSAALNMRLPQSLLDAVKIKAKKEGIPYTRYVRLILEQAVDHLRECVGNAQLEKTLDWHIRRGFEIAKPFMATRT
ncbi:MAG: BrnA antitoxin family protein [Synergistaceae bacterium]|jgi:predicted DNA binding CopG/RHH family protein|nr:BrnA antitoxin family protein [Synergistaceae bacterium]